MSEKALKAALGVLAGLVLVYVLVVFAGGRGPGDSGGGALARALDGLAEATTATVSIIDPVGERIDLARAGDRWTVNGFASDSGAVARFWTAVDEARVGDMVASNPANHARLGVDADSTWSVSFTGTDGDEVEVLLGGSGAGFTSGYARLPEEDAVYLVEGGLRGAATRRADDWRDRTIVRVDTAAVARVSVSRGPDVRTVVREEGAWSVDGAAADTVAVRGLLSELAGLQATGFAEPDTPFEGSDRRSVTVLGTSGDTLAVVELAIEESTVLARTPDSPVVYQLTSWRADRLAPALDDLVAGTDGGS